MGGKFVLGKRGRRRFEEGKKAKGGKEGIEGRPKTDGRVGT